MENIRNMVKILFIIHSFILCMVLISDNHSVGLYKVIQNEEGLEFLHLVASFIYNKQKKRK